MVFYLGFAGRIIRINCVYKNVGILGMDYLLEESVPDIEITITEDDIALEIEKNLVGLRETKKDLDVFKPAYVETLLAYKKIAAAMIDYQTILMHGTVIGLGEEAVMISAVSGVGKTTITKAILSKIEGAIIVNGDKPLVEISDNSGIAVAYGTPWCGKEHISTNCGMKLGKIFFLSRGKENEIKKVNGSVAFALLMQQTHKLNDSKSNNKVIHLLAELSSRVEIYSLSVKYSDDADCVDVDEFVRFLKS